MLTTNISIDFYSFPCGKSSAVRLLNVVEHINWSFRALISVKTFLCKLLLAHGKGFWICYHNFTENFPNFHKNFKDKHFPQYISKAQLSFVEIIFRQAFKTSVLGKTLCYVKNVFTSKCNKLHGSAIKFQKKQRQCFVSRFFIAYHKFSVMMWICKRCKLPLFFLVFLPRFEWKPKNKMKTFANLVQN